jgi:hypothetical protein
MNVCMYVCVGDFENMANFFPTKVKLLEFTLLKKYKISQFLCGKKWQNFVTKKISDPNWFSGWAEEKKKHFPGMKRWGYSWFGHLGWMFCWFSVGFQFPS